MACFGPVPAKRIETEGHDHGRPGNPGLQQLVGSGSSLGLTLLLLSGSPALPFGGALQTSSVTENQLGVE